MKVALESILATRNRCAANMVKQITTERKAAHGYFSDNNRSVAGNKKVKLREIRTIVSSINLLFTKQNRGIGEKGKCK